MTNLNNPNVKRLIEIIELPKRMKKEDAKARYEEINAILNEKYISYDIDHKLELKANLASDALARRIWH